MGIGPTRPAWKAGILPLNYTRTLIAHPFFNAIRVYHKRPRRVKNFGPLFANFFHEIFLSRDRPLPFRGKTAFIRPAKHFTKTALPCRAGQKGLDLTGRLSAPGAVPVGIPPTSGHVHQSLPGEDDPFLLQQGALDAGTAEGKAGRHPARLTTRWQGMTPGRGLACSAVPTARAARGLPASAAICP